MVEESKAPKKTPTLLHKPEVGIVGGGVVGLSSGIEALRQGYKEVTIYEASPHDPTLAERPEQLLISRASEAGAAQWLPFFEGAVPDEREAQQIRWIEDSLDSYLKREAQTLYQDAMTRKRNVELLEKTSPMPEYLKNALQRLGTVKEFGKIPENPLKFTYGWDFTTYAINSPAMLQALETEFKDLGGNLVTRKIQDQEDFYGLPQEVLINCMGLKARDIFGNEKLGLEAVKGQLLFYKNPGIETIISANDLILLPRSADRLVVGCLYLHEGEFSVEEPTEEDANDLKDRMAKLVEIDIQAFKGIQDKLISAELVGQTSAFRPYRKEGILVAAEEAGKSDKLVIHHLGHGGIGYTVAPGTARETIRLVKSLT